MRKRILLKWLVATGLFLCAITFWFAVSPARVSADCGTPEKSSCITCHTEVEHSSEMGEWNNAHMNQDMCTSCHGGNGSTMDKDLAHAGLIVQPLSDIYNNCHSCHPSDYFEKSSQFASVLDVTPGNCITPTPAAIGNSYDKMPPGSGAVPSNLAEPGVHQQPFLWITGFLVTLVLFLAGLSWLSKNHLKS
jgi:hypothetical protein